MASSVSTSTGPGSPGGGGRRGGASTGRWIAGLVLAAAFVAGLVWATLEQSGVSCEVCVDYQGRSACRRASGPDRESALRTAQMAACAVLSDGVTRGLECDRTPPRSAVCEDREGY